MELNLSTLREQEPLLIVMVATVKQTIMFGYLSTGSGPYGFCYNSHYKQQKYQNISKTNFQFLFQS